MLVVFDEHRTKIERPPRVGRAKTHTSEKCINAIPQRGIKLYGAIKLRYSSGARMELHRLMEDYVLLDEDGTVVESGHFAAYRTHPWALLGDYGQGAARKLTGYAANDADGHRLPLTAVGCKSWSGNVPLPF